MKAPEGMTPLARLLVFLGLLAMFVVAVSSGVGFAVGALAGWGAVT